MHQLTAYGGAQSHPVPFQQAIAQSPGWRPIAGNDEQESLLKRYLDTLGVKNISEVRTLPEKALSDANARLVGQSPYGLTTFGQ